jgi:hypothetical protein
MTNIKTNSIKKLILYFILCLVVSTLILSVIVYSEFNKLNNNYTKFKETGTQYSISQNENYQKLFGGESSIIEIKFNRNDYDISSRYKKYLDNGYTAIFENSQNVYINLIQFNEGKIFVETKYGGNILYKKDKFYISPGTFDSEYNSNPFETNDTYSSPSIMENEREQPTECYRNLKTFFETKQLANFKKVNSTDNISKEIIDNINSDNNYIYYSTASKNSLNSYQEKMTGESYDIEIETQTILYEKYYSIETMINKWIFIFLLIFAIPFLIYSKKLISNI